MQELCRTWDGPVMGRISLHAWQKETEGAVMAKGIVPMLHTRQRLHAWRRVSYDCWIGGKARGAYPLKVSVSLCVSPSISKILIVLSDEQVASRRP